jgi:hypothetical protein
LNPTRGDRTPARARHELPAIDEAALRAARLADLVLVDLRRRGSDRWVAFLEPIPDGLRDAPLTELPLVARRGRAAFGPQDSIADILDPSLSEAFKEALDALLRLLAREAATEGGGG